MVQLGYASFKTVGFNQTEHFWDEVNEKAGD